MGIIFKANSLLAFLTVVSFLGWLVGTSIQSEVGKQITSISMPVFIICFGIWLIFIFLTIARNIKKF
jgi:membrane protein DedA with SNARE-associated domain